jgi:hypothetical protein
VHGFVRQKMALERGTPPKLSRNTCSPRYGLQPSVYNRVEGNRKRLTSSPTIDSQFLFPTLNDSGGGHRASGARCTSTHGRLLPVLSRRDVVAAGDADALPLKLPLKLGLNLRLSACEILPLCRFPPPVLIPKSNLIWDLIQPVSPFPLHFNKPLQLTFKPNHPLLRAGGKGSAYTVDLYHNPTAPLIPLYPKSPVGKTGRGEISPAPPLRSALRRRCLRVRAPAPTATRWGGVSEVMR